MAKCIKCGAEAGLLMSMCGACIGAQQAEIRQQYAAQEDEQVRNAAELESRADQIICTTAPSLDGYRVTQTLEVITAECVLGMNVFRDIFASLTDFFGGRSEASQKVLRDARRTCLSELKKEAAKIGANAVIAVKLDYSEFSGAGKSMLFLVASGTAVKIEPSNGHTK